MPLDNKAGAPRKARMTVHPFRRRRPNAAAVTVRANWRIIFRLANGRAFDVDFVDYH
jgi:proteic killer suppression protein